MLALDASGASIGLPDGSHGVIPFEEMRWARKIDDEDRLGPVPRQPGDVLTSGRCGDGGGAPRPAPDAKEPPARSRATPCARSPR